MKIFFNAAWKYDHFTLDKLLLKREQIVNTITILEHKRGKREKESLLKFNQYLQVINEAIKSKEVR